MSLFGVTVPDADPGYLNLKAAQDPREAQIKDGLEALWVRYEAYADSNFQEEFARHPDDRFWEMYLTVRFLSTRRKRKMRTRSEVPAADRDAGPDICIRKCSRRIWIEAIAPEQGDQAENLDRVPDLGVGIAVDDERRRVELRITSALLKKRDKFQEYREQRIIADNDSCVIAISGCHFPLQAVHFGLPPALTAVYPFGEEQHFLDPNAETIITHHKHSADIRRGENKGAIPRTAFQHEYFNGIAGLIWSRRSTGNFCGQPDDFVFIHNSVALRPIPRSWIAWAEEYYPIEEAARLRRRQNHNRRRYP